MNFTTDWQTTSNKCHKTLTTAQPQSIVCTIYRLLQLHIGFTPALPLAGPFKQVKKPDLGCTISSTIPFKHYIQSAKCIISYWQSRPRSWGCFGARVQTPGYIPQKHTGFH